MRDALHFQIGMKYFHTTRLNQIKVVAHIQH